MDEYISREAVFDEIRFQRELAESDGEASVVDTCDAMLHNLKEIKAADVQPVKHGRWETWGYIFHGIAWKRCSVCGKTADISYQALLDGKIEMATPSICGCCSARMDGGSE